MVVTRDPDVDAIIVETAAAVTTIADTDFPVLEMAPADATSFGSSFSFAHAAEMGSDATMAAEMEMATAAGSSSSFCSSAEAVEMAAAADLSDETRESLPGFLKCRAGENPLPSFSYLMLFQIEQEFSLNKFISIIFSFFFLILPTTFFLIFHLFSLYTLQI